MEGSHEERTIIRKALDAALVPVHAAVSKPARRAYLSTLLFLAASLFLLGISGLAYTLFYYNYVPQIGIERIIHLQFGDGNPYGFTSLSSALTSYQPYDISLLLHLPRTPNNIAVGNFMLDLSLLVPDAKTSTSEKLAPSFLPKDVSTSVIVQSRRPAILTYTSLVVNLANTMSSMPWYLMGWKKESEVLEVRMFEGVEFRKGWKNIPQSAKVIIEADRKMQFYNVEIKFIARFKGLRWILYHHRIFSFIFFTTAFWASSMISMLAAWLILSVYYSSPASETFKTGSVTTDTAIKDEASDSEEFDPFSMEDLSDTSRSFPTLGRQMPLHYSRRKEATVKTEEEKESAKAEEEEVARSTKTLLPLNAEADDEQDDEDLDLAGWRDSGIGTSLDDGRLRAVERRRRALFDEQGKS